MTSTQRLIAVDGDLIVVRDPDLIVVRDPEGVPMVRPKRQSENRQVFAGWMADHHGIIVKIVRGFTLNPADADDLSQDIALALWRSIGSFRGEAKPSTWIWRIALNQAIAWQRSAKGPHVHLDAIEPPAHDRADDLLLVDRIYVAIQTLNPIDRSLIMLSLEGYRYSEIADIAGLTETNVGARLSRARTRLNEHLEGAR